MSEYPVRKTDEAWKAQLSPKQFEIARRGNTELAFTGAYWDHWMDGQYCCICCKTPLFDAEDKFDAGCGWPSYSKPLSENTIEKLPDNSFGMQRTEVRCQQCGAHLGHVFHNESARKGDRYCINSASLCFKSR